MLRAQQKIKSRPAAAKPVASTVWWTRSKQLTFIALGLVVLVLAVYGQTARGVFGFTRSFWPGEPFQFIGLDDGDYYVSNPNIKLGLTPETIRWAFFENFSANWHPLTWMSLMLDCNIYGLNPGGPHITNMLLHLGSVLLIFAILLKMTDRMWFSATVAALWAVHPLHVESVAWISERKDNLSTFFALLAILAYVAYARQPAIGRYLLVVAAFTLSMLSKQMWVTLPCVLLLLDYWPLGRTELVGAPEGAPPFAKGSLRWLAIEKLPLFAMSFGFSVMIYIIQKDAGAVSDFETVPFATRIPNVLFSYWMYFYKTFWPTNLAIMYPYPPGGIPWKTGLLCAIPLAVISVLAVYGWRRWPWFLVGWLWYLGTLVPVIGFVSIGSHSWADRYAYVPHIGLFMALVWSGAAIFGWLRNLYGTAVFTYIGAAVAVLCIAALTVSANKQVALWDNTEHLFTHTIAVTDDNYGMCTTLASWLAAMDKLEEAKKYYKMALDMDVSRNEAMVHCAVCIMNNQGDIDEAIMLLDKALEIDPKDPMAMVQLGLAYVNKGKLEKGVELIEKAPEFSRRKLPTAYVALGIIESRRGNLAKAEAHFKHAIEIDPTEAGHLNVLGSFYTQLGQFAKAESIYRESLKYSPNDLGARLDLGALAVQRGRVDEAMRYFEDAVRLRPGNADAHNRLAGGLMAQGKVPQAITEFETAIRLRPQWAPPYNDLAWSLATDDSPKVRSGRRAVELAEKACQLTKREDAALLDTLAAAYAEMGRFDDALRTIDEAKRVAIKNNPGMIEGIEKHEAVYQRKQAWREPSRAAAEAVRTKAKRPDPTSLPPSATPATTATTAK